MTLQAPSVMESPYQAKVAGIGAVGTDPPLNQFLHDLRQQVRPRWAQG